MLFIDYMLRPENVKKNIEYIGYPMPVLGTEDTYAALVEPFPQCLVTADDLKADLFFRNGDARAEQARDAAWTDVKSRLTCHRATTGPAPGPAPGPGHVCGPGSCSPAPSG